MRDAQHLHTMISNTSDLAEKVSSKVRLLDLVKVGHTDYRNYHNNTDNLMIMSYLILFHSLNCNLFFCCFCFQNDVRFLRRPVISFLFS